MSPTQSLQTIGFSKETTFGTFVAPAKFVPGTAQINPTNTVTQPSQSRGTRSQVLDVVTAHTVSAQISCELIPEVISQLIAGWFGTGSDTVTGSSGAGYTHTFAPQASCPSFSVEIDSDIYSQVLAEQAVGNIIDQMTLTYQAQQITTAQFQTVGQRMITPTTPGLPSNPTPAISTLQPMDFSLLAASYNSNATTQLISATLTAANQTQSVPSSNGHLYVTRLQPTQRKVTFSTTLDFLDTTFFASFATPGATPALSSVLAPFSLVLTSAGNVSGASNPYTISFSLPNMRPQDQYSLSAASDVLQQQLSWSVTQGAAAAEITAAIRNSESAALA